MSTPVTPASPQNEPSDWTLSQDTTLMIAMGLLAAFFVFTGFMSRFYHQTERSQARQWSARGDAARQAGRLSEAIQDYRAALVYSRENGETSSANETYDLHLAEALAATGQVDEARAYFVSLAEKAPGKADVNLELARLAARQENVAEASRYYNAAIFGVWDVDPAAQRRAARIEYAKFLLDHSQTAEAQAQLFAMSAALPNATAADAPLHVQAGNLLLEAGANSQALAEFRRAMQLDSESAEAVSGAGTAAFRAEDYPQAVRYLERAAYQREPSAEEKRSLETSRLVESLDPFITSISTQQRAKRAAFAFSIALKRAQACVAVAGTAASGGSAENSELQQLIASAAKIGAQADERNLVAHPENISRVMDSAFSMEKAAGGQCGQGAPEDVALQLISRVHEGIVQ